MFKEFLSPTKHKIRTGVILIVIGFLALITPFTPGSWLILVGLGVIGYNPAFLEKIKIWFKK